MKSLKQTLLESSKINESTGGPAHTWVFEYATYIIDHKKYNGYIHYVHGKGKSSVPVLMLNDISDRRQNTVKIAIFEGTDADKFTRKEGTVSGKGIIFNCTTIFDLSKIKPLNGDKASDVVESMDIYSEELLKKLLIDNFNLDEDAVDSCISHEIQIEMNFEGMWASKDAYGREFIFTSEPYRNDALKSWGPMNYEDMYYKLPKGTIKKLTGKDMKWKDEPMEIK